MLNDPNVAPDINLIDGSYCMAHVFTYTWRMADECWLLNANKKRSKNNSAAYY